MSAKTYDLNGNLIDNGQCMTVACLPTPEICGSPPPPCNPCCDEPKVVCRPMPTRNAIKLRGGEIGRYFKFSSTFTDPNWFISSGLELQFAHFDPTTISDYLAT